MKNIIRIMTQRNMKRAELAEAADISYNYVVQLINGKKIFASLAGHADYYGVLCTEAQQKSRRNTLYVAVPADAEGVTLTLLLVHL